MVCEHFLTLRSLAAARLTPLARCDLPANLSSPQQARQFVAKALSGRPLPPATADDPELIASELVANGVLLARGKVHLGIAEDEHTLLIAVTAERVGTSRSRARPPPACQDSDDRISLVAGVADDFGWEPPSDNHGLTTWATLTIPTRHADGDGR